MDKTILARLLARSRWEGECLVWTGALSSSGYGVISIGGRRGYCEGVHRAAWMARHGELPIERPFVLHHCDNPPCFRDEHLFPGTHADNMEDKRRKGRASRAGGRARRGAGMLGEKLTFDQVIVIKRRLVAGEPQRSIASDYGVSQVAISHIRRDRNWADVPWPTAL